MLKVMKAIVDKQTGFKGNGEVLKPMFEKILQRK
jgi:hypothetical protein